MHEKHLFPHTWSQGQRVDRRDGAYLEPRASKSGLDRAVGFPVLLALSLPLASADEVEFARLNNSLISAVSSRVVRGSSWTTVFLSPVSRSGRGGAEVRPGTRF